MSRIERNRDDVGIVVGGKELQVSGGVKPPVDHEQDPGELKEIGDVSQSSLVVAGPAVHPGKQRSPHVDVITHEQVDLVLLQAAELITGLPKVVLIRTGADRVAVDGDGGRGQDRGIFITDDPGRAPSQAVEQGTERCLPHTERKPAVLPGEPALLIIALHLVQMDKTIGIKDAAVCKDLCRLILWEMLFQFCKDRLCDLCYEGILTVFKDRDLIPGFFSFV